MLLPSSVHCCAVVCLLLAGPASAQEILTGEPTSPPAATADAAAVPAADRVWEPVTVTTNDGWNLAAVSLRWLADGSRVRVTRADGSWKDYQPWTVTAVHAADGADLTAEVAAARPGGGAAVADPHRTYDEFGAAVPVTVGLGGDRDLPRTFAVAVTVGGGYGAYVGDWYNGFGAAPALQATVRIGTGARNWVTLSYRRQGGGTRSISFYDFDLNPVYADVDLRVDEFLALVGFLTKPSGSTRHRPYAELGLAVLNHVGSASASGYRSESYSETKLGLALQFGGLIALGKQAVLDLGLDLIHKPGLFSDDEGGGTIAGFHAGVGLVVW